MKRGKSEGEIARFLQLQTVPEPMATEERVQVAAAKRWADDATPHDVEMHSTRGERGNIERLRAINRAPDAVKQAAAALESARAAP